MAGGVVFSALQMLPFILSNPNLPPSLANGILFIDFVALGGFVISVYFGVRNVKDTRIHGRWMIATVFWSLLPALIRFLNYPVGKIVNWDLNFTELVYVTNGLVFLSMGLIILIDYSKEKIIYTSYSIIAIVMIIMSISYSYMVEAPWWGNFLKVLLKN
ncbi:hypothetical protein GCM10022257_07230 [Hyunsoonleella aestuarii]|uniref:Uncharacterized protein n=1 Tax=Hyunsoonleella aestuarii TaxID=912802 RepID=A0ABP8E8S5_9FLAO